MTTTDVREGLSTDLSAKADRHLWGHFARHGAGNHPADHHPRRRRHHLGQQRQELYRRPLRPFRGAGRPRTQGARGGRRQAGRAAGLLPAVVVCHPARDRAGRADRRLRARRSQPRLLHHRWRRGRRDRVEAGQAVLQADRQTRQAQGRLACDRLSRHPAGRAGDHRPAGVQGAVRAADPGRLPGAQHQLLPGARAVSTPTSRRSASTRRPHRRGHRVRGSRHRRRGLPGAGAERRRLLPAAARVLRAGPRDLRRVRRAAGVRRGDLRLRAGSARCSPATTSGMCPT